MSSSTADATAMESWLTRLGVDVCLKHAIAVLLETSPRPDTLGAAVEVIVAELRTECSLQHRTHPLPTPTTALQLQVQLRLPASGRHGADPQADQATTPPPALCTGATTLREFSKYAEVETGIDPLDQEWILSMRRQVAEAMGETKGSDDDDEAVGLSTGAPATLRSAAALLPRQMKADETAAWVRSQGALSPRDKRLLNRGRFTGANLVGSSIIQRLTEDDVHKATGVIFHMTKAELKAVYDKADITGNAPEFEDAVVDGETLHDLFTTQSIEAVIGDYFQTDELRALGERLWADLTLIDDASRARDARRIFCILTPLLADLRARQEKGDAAQLLDREQKEMEERQGDTSNRRYAVGTDKAKPGDDPADADDDAAAGGGKAKAEEEDDAHDASGTATVKTKDGGKGTSVSTPSLDLVARAFEATAIVEDGSDETAGGMEATGGGAASATALSYPVDATGGAKLLEDWNRAVERKDWKGMTRCGELFAEISTSYGQCIIEGRADTGDMQAFTAKLMGGIAGGKKFVEKRILFKVRRHAVRQTWCGVVCWYCVMLTLETWWCITLSPR